LKNGEGRREKGEGRRETEDRRTETIDGRTGGKIHKLNFCFSG